MCPSKRSRCARRGPLSSSLSPSPIQPPVQPPEQSPDPAHDHQDHDHDDQSVGGYGLGTHPCRFHHPRTATLTATESMAVARPTARRITGPTPSPAGATPGGIPYRTATSAGPAKPRTTI